VTYDGIHISEDMVVSVATYALHYSEEYYPDPETFNPDRYFIPEAINQIPARHLLILLYLKVGSGE